MAVSTAITHNPKLLVVLNSKGLFLTQLHGSAWGSAPRLLTRGNPGSRRLHCWRQHWLTWQGKKHSESRPVCKRCLPGGTHFCSRSTSLGQTHGPPKFYRWAVAMQSVMRASEPCEQPGMTTYEPHPKCQ